MCVGAGVAGRCRCFGAAHKYLLLFGVYAGVLCRMHMLYGFLMRLVHLFCHLRLVTRTGF